MVFERRESCSSPSPSPAAMHIDAGQKLVSKLTASWGVEKFVHIVRSFFVLRRRVCCAHCSLLRSVEHFVHIVRFDDALATSDTDLVPSDFRKRQNVPRFGDERLGQQMWSKGDSRSSFQNIPYEMTARTGQWSRHSRRPVFRDVFVQYFVAFSIQKLLDAVRARGGRPVVLKMK